MRIAPMTGSVQRHEIEIDGQLTRNERPALQKRRPADRNDVRHSRNDGQPRRNDARNSGNDGQWTRNDARHFRNDGQPRRHDAWNSRNDGQPPVTTPGT
jgi:hypothetical protein